jgi:hypothetical protein
MRVDDLIFKRHPMSEGIEDVIERDPSFPVSLGYEMSNMVQATHTFPNGWAVSVVGMMPSEDNMGLWLVHGDLRVPDYEVAIINPLGGIVGDPQYHVSETELQIILDDLERR